MFPGLESLIHCGLGQNSGDLQDFLAVLFAASDNWTIAGECDECTVHGVVVQVVQLVQCPKITLTYDYQEYLGSLRLILIRVD